MGRKNSEENGFGRRLNEWFSKIKEMSPGRFAVLLAAGVLLVIITMPNETRKTEGGEKNGVMDMAETAGKSTSGQDSDASYEKQLEERLEEVLASVKGVGKVEVMITLEASQEQVLQRDISSSGSLTEETDSSGGSRRVQESSLTENVVLTGEGGNTPYVVKEISPTIGGVLVIAEGGGNAAVKSEICGAIEALFNVPVHKIKVLEREKESK